MGVVVGGPPITDHVDTAIPVRVLIADDAPDARFLLRVWLQRHGAMDVVAEATDGVEAVEAARQEQPDLVLLDVSMPRMDGLEAAAEIRRLLPGARIVMVSAFSAERMGERAVRAGADLYVEKESGPEQIFAAIDALFGVRPLGPVARSSPAVSVELDLHETRWRLLLDALDEGVVVVDHEARVETANHAATTLLGIPTSRMVGSSLAELFAGATNADGRPFDGERPDPVTQTLRSGRPRSGVLVARRRADGGRAWLSINVRPIGGSDPTSGVRGAIAALTDVTAAYAPRRELDAAAARTQGVPDASAAPVLVVHVVRDEGRAVVDHRIAWGNAAALAGAGLEIGTHLRDTPIGAGPEGRLLARVADALDRAAAAPGASPGPAAGGTTDGGGVQWFRSGDDEIVLTWNPLLPAA